MSEQLLRRFEATNGEVKLYTMPTRMPIHTFGDLMSREPKGTLAMSKTQLALNSLEL